MRASLATIAIVLLSGFLYAVEKAPAPENSSPPAAPTQADTRLDPSFPSSNTEHLRIDEAELAKVGGGSFDQGLNSIGRGGFRLFAVTTAGDEGKSGWHLFKRPAWNLPVPRPRFEYKRIDSTGVEKLGDGLFKTGLQKIEQGGWELVAFTGGKNGDIGWFYFERPVDDTRAAEPAAH